MKRAAAILSAVLLCLMFSVVAFADNIYYVEDGEDDFTPNQTTTTTKPAETTTSGLPDFGSIIDGDAFGGYFDRFSDMLGDGLDSILSNFGDSFGQFGAQHNEGNAGNNSQLPSINNMGPGSGSSGNASPGVTASSQTASTTQQAESGQGQDAAEQTTAAQVQNTELPSVLIVNNTEGPSSGVSGSTLTLVVFIAGIIILVLVAAIVLVIMTRRTEFNSAVMNKSTIPTAPQPTALAQFMDDDIADDGNDYSNITYWNDKYGE